MKNIEAISSKFNISSTLQQENKKNKIKKWIYTSLKFLISISLLFYIIHGTNINAIWNSIRSANFLLILFAFSLRLVGLLISAKRWQILLKAQTYSVPIFYLIKSFFVALFFNNVLPSTIGGDAVRGYDIWKIIRDKARAFAIIFVDRFLGITALLLFSLIAVLFATKISTDIPFLKLLILLVFAVFIFVIWLIFFPSKKIIALLQNIRVPFSSKIKGILDKIINAFWQYRGKRVVLFRAFGLSILLQINVVFYYYVLSSSLHMQVPFYYFFLMVPLAIFIMMVPISINGIGLRENVFYYFFSFYLISKADILAFSWIEYGIIVLQGVLGGIVYLVRKD